MESSHRAAITIHNKKLPGIGRPAYFDATGHILKFQHRNRFAGSNNVKAKAPGDMNFRLAIGRKNIGPQRGMKHGERARVTSNCAGFMTLPQHEY